MADKEEPMIEKETKDDENKSMGIATFAGLIMAVLDANDMAMFSFMPTYYMHTRGLSLNDVGESWVLISVGILCFSPVIPMIMGRLGGAAKTYFYGLAIYTLTRILFVLASSLVPDSASSLYFYVNAFIFLVSGFGYSFSEIGCAAWVLSSVPEKDRSTAFAKTMEGRAVGSLLGPPLGGAIFSAGTAFKSADFGWNLTFMVGGMGMCVLLKYAFAMVFQAECTEDGKSFGFEGGFIFRGKKVMLAALMSILTFCPGMFFFALLQPWLNDMYNFGPWKFGIAMMVTSLTFILSAEMVPKMEAKFGAINVLLVSFVFIGISGLFFGPSPLLPFLPAPSTWTVWFPLMGLCILTIFVTAPCAILIAPLMMKYAVADGFPESIAASQSAMLNVGGMGFCMLFGTLPATTLATAIGTPWACTVGGFGFVAVALILGFMLKAEEAKSPKVEFSKA